MATPTNTTNDNVEIEIADSASSNSNIKEEGQEEIDATILKRRQIQNIRNDSSLDELTKRIRIQQLMDGSNRLKNGQINNGNANNTNTSLSASSTSTVTSGGAFSEVVRRNSTTGLVMATSTSSNENNIDIITGTTNTVTNSRYPSNYVANNVHVMKCVHYEDRKCNIISPCCSQIFGCRVCHDEMVTDGHEINRFLIREIVCKECHTKQDRSNKCINCNIIFGEYHCNICNLWMNTQKMPFHCDECGICRVGGREHFKHCDSCAMCIKASTFDSHICLKDKFKNSCPVCREDMHTSRHTTMDLICGHAIHSHCFRKLAGYEYRCPICKKTLLNPNTMARAWEERARDIAEQPMPDDLAKKVDILCYDCGAKSQDRDWHFLGVQCLHCQSFNTAIENSHRNTHVNTNNNNGSNGS